MFRVSLLFLAMAVSLPGAGPAWADDDSDDGATITEVFVDFDGATIQILGHHLSDEGVPRVTLGNEGPRGLWPIAAEIRLVHVHREQRRRSRAGF